MAQYSIKDVEVLSGVKAHTLRVWERRYDFLKPRRTPTNIRYYDDDQLRLLLNISTLSRKGFRISKIAEMSERELNSELLKTGETENSNDLTDALIRAMIDFDESRFEKALSSGILKLGFEKAFSELIFPFLMRTGVLWATGAIRPVQEHFVSNLVRRKISVAIDSVYAEANPNAQKFVLFLPEGETHELLLLFTEYLLRSRGHHVTYLGSSVPLSDIEYLKEAFNPDVLVVYFTVALTDTSTTSYLHHLSQLYPGQKILAGGMQAESLNEEMPSNIIVINSIEKLRSVIE